MDVFDDNHAIHFVVWGVVALGFFVCVILNPLITYLIGLIDRRRTERRVVGVISSAERWGNVQLSRRRQMVTEIEDEMKKREGRISNIELIYIARLKKELDVLQGDIEFLEQRKEEIERSPVV